MAKTALVYRKKNSPWISCRAITTNLVKCYQDIYGDSLELVEIEGDTTFDAYVGAEKIRAIQPDRVCWVDHAPSPATIIRALGLLYSKDTQPRLPEFFIHVFGDFTLQCNEWLAASETLSKTKVKWICASEKQSALIRSFLSVPNSSVDTIPFPVHFDCTPKLPPSGKTTFLYAGRLSLQKNLLFLIKLFASYLTQIDPQAELLLAGPIDDLAAPMIGKQSIPGLFIADLLRLIQTSLPPGLRSNIRYLGDLKQEALAHTMSQSHFFLSLSAHNDEDFGMAPAEALMAGCPLILSDWGGYSGFGFINDFVPGACTLIPMEIQKKEIVPDFLTASKALLAASSKTYRLEDRNEIRARAIEQFSIRAVSRKISRVHSDNSDFQGFSERFFRLALAFRMDPTSPLGVVHEHSALYREIYGTYL